MQESTAAFKEIGKKTEYYATRICLIIIKFYRLFISPFKPRVCRFYPSCSEYTYEAVQRYGIFKGMYKGIKRIIRCHPFNPGGYNPVE